MIVVVGASARDCPSEVLLRARVRVILRVAYVPRRWCLRGAAASDTAWWCDRVYNIIYVYTRAVDNDEDRQCGGGGDCGDVYDYATSTVPRGRAASAPAAGGGGRRRRRRRDSPP